MKLKDILSITYTAFSKLSASSLIKAFQSLREKYIKLEKENNALKAENERLIALLKKQKIQSINKDANKPSSKRPEWNKSGAGNDRKEKKNGKGRGKKPRKGAGNRPKKLKPDRTEKATVDNCSICGKDLSKEKALETSNSRIIEDIPDVVEKPAVIKVEQEKKYTVSLFEYIGYEDIVFYLRTGGEINNFESVGKLVKFIDNNFLVLLKEIENRFVHNDNISPFICSDLFDIINKMFNVELDAYSKKVILSNTILFKNLV